MLHHWAVSHPVLSQMQRRSSFLKPQSSPSSGDLRCLKSLPHGNSLVPSLQTWSPSLTDKCGAVRTLPPSGLNKAMLCCLVSVLTVKGTYLFIAMISTFLGFSWVMSLFNLSAKAMPGFTNARQQGYYSRQRKHWVPSDNSCSAVAEGRLSETAACRCHLSYSGVTVWINPFCVKPP